MFINIQHKVPVVAFHNIGCFDDFIIKVHLDEIRAGFTEKQTVHFLSI